MAREARVFARYLGVPNADLGAHYAAMHGPALDPADALDQWLVALARVATPWTMLADTYARIARPHGALRRKLTLVYALLESGAATHARIDRAHAAGRVATWGALGLLGVCWSIQLLLAVLVLGPVHLAAAFAGGRNARA